MLGRGFSLLMCAVMILYPFGSCIAYLVITGALSSGCVLACRRLQGRLQGRLMGPPDGGGDMHAGIPPTHPPSAGDSFQPLLQHLAGGAAWYTSRAAIIAGVGCAGILPLCFRTRLAALKGAPSARPLQVCWLHGAPP